MATWTLGDVGDDVAKIQSFLARLHRANPKLYPAITVSGSFDAATASALKAYQRASKVPQTGQWDDRTRTAAHTFAKYVTAGKSSDPFAGFRTISEDRTYVLGQWKELYDRNPTAAELNAAVSTLQSGVARTTWVATAEKANAGPTTDRIFKEILHRDPTAAERTQYAGMLSTGKMTRATMRAYLAATPEAKEAAKETSPSEDDEDARSAMNDLLDSMDLGSLKDWAWQQIKDGKSALRIEQALRETPEWKTRFAAIEAMKAAGLPALSEGQVLEYETQAKALFRQYGLPAGFYDQIDDFVGLIAGNVSPQELAERVQNGFVQVANAPLAIRNQFAEWYGAAGDSALAAFFLDPEKATPHLQKMITTAEIGGTGDTFGYDLSQERAGQIAEAGVTGDQARTGFSELNKIDPLFAESVTEDLDMTAEDQGADAVFQLGGKGAQLLEQRGRERNAAFAGGGGAALGSRGTGVGTSD